MSKPEDTRRFKSDPMDRLGINNSEFKEQLNELSFSKPSEYFKMKREYQAYIMKNVIKMMYSTIFHSLTDGRKVDLNGNVQSDFIIPQNNQSTFQFKPNYSQEKADELSMNICATLKKVIEEQIVNEVFHTAQLEKALDRGAKRAENSLE